MSTVRTVGPPVAYAAVCALLMMFTSVHVFDGGSDLALAAIPLILGMGAVEWRAERFAERAVTLLERCEDIREFRRRVRRALVGELTAVLAILATLAGVLLAALAATGGLTRPGAWLVGAHVLLGGVFFLGFVLGRHAHFPRVVAAMALVAITYVAAVLAPSGPVRPDHLVAIFLATTTALVLVLLAAFAASTRRVQLFTW